MTKQQQVLCRTSTTYSVEPRRLLLRRRADISRACLQCDSKRSTTGHFKARSLLCARCQATLRFFGGDRQAQQQERLVLDIRGHPHAGVEEAGERVCGMRACSWTRDEAHLQRSSFRAPMQALLLPRPAFSPQRPQATAT
jgi:hypothetical protein